MIVLAPRFALQPQGTARSQLVPLGHVRVVHRHRSASSQWAAVNEQIGIMRAVRREAITEACGKLWKLGLVHRGRGHIMVIGRAGVEARSRECHDVVSREFD